MTRQQFRDLLCDLYTHAKNGNLESAEKAWDEIMAEHVRRIEQVARHRIFVERVRGLLNELDGVSARGTD